MTGADAVLVVDRERVVKGFCDHEGSRQPVALTLISLRGAMRDITGQMIHRGYQPRGYWRTVSASEHRRHFVRRDQ